MNESIWSRWSTTRKLPATIWVALAFTVLAVIACSNLNGSDGLANFTEAKIPIPTAADTPTPAPTNTPAPTATVTPTPIPIHTGDPGVCSRAGGCATFKPGEPIKIGVAGPMADSNWGPDSFQAAQLAAGDAGSLNEYTFELVQVEDHGSQDTAARVANDLAADPAVVAVVGHNYSGVTKRAMPIYASKYIPMMSPSATNSSLTQSGNPAFNRLVSMDKLQGNVGAQFMAQNLGLKKVAIAQDGSDYAQRIANAAQAALQKGGVKVVAYEMFKPGGTDYTTLLKKIGALEPDGVFFSGTAADGATIIVQMQALGLKAAFVGNDALIDPQFLNMAGQVGEGAYAVTLGVPITDARKKYDERIAAAIGEPVEGRTPAVWFAYDATRVLIEAVKKVAFQSGDTLYIPRKTLMDAVRHTKDYQGISGVVTCAANGECATAPTYVVFRVQGGQFAQLPADYRP